MVSNSKPTSLDSWVSTTTFLDLYPEFKKATVEYLLREREQLGLNEAVRVIGRTRYVSIPRFADWLENGCRRTRPGGPRKQRSDLISEGEARKNMGRKTAEHTVSTNQSTDE
jgi:hypothetical protein